MRTFNQWMDEYGESHQNPKNQIIHKICVPLIMFSVIGFFWCIPRVDFFGPIYLINWATLFVGACLLFYLSLNFLMFCGMFIMTFFMIGICHQLQMAGILLPVSAIVFIISWIFQFYGHKIEGKKPSFLKDLVFLLIGPLWVLRFFYSRMGIKI